MPALRGTKREFSSLRSPYRQDPSYWARKITTLEKRVRNNTPEKKYLILSGQHLLTTGGEYAIFPAKIPEGLGPDERVGTRIRILSLEVQGETAAPLDVYIIRAQDDKDLPTLSDFVGTEVGSFTRPERLHTYAHTITGAWGDSILTTSVGYYPFKMKKSFGTNGLLCEFDGSGGLYTECTRNPLWVVFLNHSPIGTSQRVAYNTKITYTDA